MKTLGVFEAKTKLSEVVTDVSTGSQVYIITKKGKPVAELRPISSARDDAQAAADGLRRLSRELAAEHGKVSPADVRAMINKGRRLR